MKSLKKLIKYSLLSFLVILVATVSMLLIQGKKLNENRENMEVLANNGGFDSVVQYQAALEKGYKTKYEYDQYLEKTKQEAADAAKAGGFDSVNDFILAQAVGIPTKELYDKYLLEQAEVKLVEENREADEVENMRTALAADEKREVENLNKLEKSRLAALAPSLTMKCENQKGWEVYIMHLSNVATIIKPVKNPTADYNPIANNVKILNYGDSMFWYDEKDLNRGFNFVASPTYRGITTAKLDLRKELLGRKNDPSFYMGSEIFLNGKWQPIGETFKCFDLSPTEFNEVLLRNKIK